MMDYYNLLGVKRDCGEQEILQAFRKRAKQWHPDKNSGLDAEDVFVQLKKARDTLINPETRAAYDLTTQATVPPKPMGRKRTFDKETVINNVQQDKKKKLDSQQNGTNGVGLNIIEQLQRAYAAQASGSSISNEALSNLLRVTWKKVGHSKDELQNTFAKNGVIQDIVLMSKKRKGSALIIFKTVTDRTLPSSLPADVSVAWLDAKKAPTAIATSKQEEPLET